MSTHLDAQEKKEVTLSKTDYILLAIAFPRFSQQISSLLNLSYSGLKGALALTKKNLKRALIAFKLMDIEINKDAIERIINDENARISLLTRFYRKHPEMFKDKKDLLFLLLLKKKLDITEIDTNDLQQFLRKYDTRIDKKYKISVMREIVRRYHGNWSKLPDKKLLFYLMETKSIALKDVPTELLNEFLVSYKGKIDEKLEIEISYLLVKRNVKNLLNFPDNLKLSIMKKMEINTLLKVPLSLYRFVFDILYEKFGDEMWIYLTEYVTEDNLPMIALLVTLADEDLVPVVALRILTKKKDILKGPFNHIFSAFAGNQIEFTQEIFEELAKVYTEELLTYILDKLQKVVNINAKDLFQVFQATPKQLIKQAIALNAIQELPKDILFSIGVLAPDLFVNSVMIPKDYKYEFAATFVHNEKLTEFVKEVLSKDPLGMLPYLYHILTVMPKYISEVINYGGNITRIALYAMAFISKRRRWNTKKVISELNKYKESCPADIESMVKELKKGKSFVDVLKDYVGDLDKELMKQYVPSVYKKYSQMINETQAVQALIKSNLKFISQQQSPKKQKELFKQFFWAVPDQYRALVIEQISSFNLEEIFFDIFVRLLRVSLLRSSNTVVEKKIIHAVTTLFNRQKNRMDILNLLKQLLYDKDSRIRDIAAKILSNIVLEDQEEKEKALEIIKPLLKESSPYIQKTAIQFIKLNFAGSKYNDAIKILEPLVKNPNNVNVKEVVKAITSISDEAHRDKIVSEILKPLLNNSNPVIKRVAIESISVLFEGTGSKKAFSLIKPLLKDSDYLVVEATILGIANIFRGTKNKKFLKMLEKLIETSNFGVRRAIAEAIGIIFENSGDMDTLDVLKLLLKDLDFGVKRTTINAIGSVFRGTGNRIVLNLLKPFLSEHGYDIRACAASAIGSVFRGSKDKNALKLLTPLLQDSWGYVRRVAIQAMNEINQ